MTPPYTITTHTAYGDIHTHVNVPAHEKTSAPIVVLLHGVGGTLDDMSNPAARPGFNYDHTSILADRDEGFRFAAPVVSPAPPGAPFSAVFHAFDLDPLMPVRSWQEALLAFGFRTAIYEQQGDSQPIASQDLGQLEAILRQLFTDANHAGRDFAIVAHSRGGILARAALVNARRNHTFDLQRIKQVITLHSPHLGSGLANAAVGIANSLQILQQLTGSLSSSIKAEVDSLFAWIRSQVDPPTYRDFELGSPFLAQLRVSEPVPGIQYFTFGGNSAHYGRLRLWSYTADSALPTLNIPPFHWYSEPTIQDIFAPSFNSKLVPYLALLGIPPGLPLPPEMTHGIGDGLVTDTAARLPFASHKTNALNHAEALWDTKLQEQVAWILDPINGPANQLPPLSVSIQPDPVPLDRPITLTVFVHDAATGAAVPGIIVEITTGKRHFGSPETRRVAANLATRITLHTFKENCHYVSPRRVDCDESPPFVTVGAPGYATTHYDLSV